MDIFKLFSYKLENFLNIRPHPKELGPVFYAQEEISLLSVAARKSDGSTFSVSRWQDLFSVSAFKKAMSKIGFSEPDCYASSWSCPALAIFWKSTIAKESTRIILSSSTSFS